MERPHEMFDVRGWVARRTEAVGARRTLDDVAVLHGRSMTRGFLLECAPPWPCTDPELAYHAGEASPLLPEDRDLRRIWSLWLHIAGLIWTWARHPSRRPEIARVWWVLRPTFENWRSEKPEEPHIDWVVAIPPGRRTGLAIFDAVVEEDPTIAGDLIGMYVPWSMTYPGLLALRDDTEAFDNGGSIVAVSDAPLWTAEERPNQWPECWTSAKAAFPLDEPSWVERVDWIDGRVRGDAMDERLDVGLFARAWTDP